MADYKISDLTAYPNDYLQSTDLIEVSYDDSGTFRSRKVTADKIRPYKVYVALLTQTSTNAPTATVLENTLGGTVVWSYSATGQYLATLTGAFTSSKTAIYIQDGVKTGGGNYYVTASRVSADVVAVYSSDNSFNGINGGISNRTIEIRVYI